MQNDTLETNTPAHQDTDPPVDLRRREALQKLAVYGAYTAPALLGLLNAEKAVAQTIIF